MAWIFRLFKFLITLAIMYGAARFGVVYFSSQLTGEREPYLQILTDESVIVRWQTDEPRMGVVKYGRSPDRLHKLVLEQDVTRIHEVRLIGLAPDTRYYYAVGDITGYQADHEHNWFQTMPKPGVHHPTRIWVIGDHGYAGEISRNVYDAMRSWVAENPRKGRKDIDVWLSLGDMAYTSGTDEQFQRAFFNVYPKLLRNTPIWPVLGNHDARRWTWFNIFTLPERGEAGGVPSFTENYYSFEYGDVHFVMLDSESSSLEPDGAMLQWLKHDLARNDKTWLIAAVHHPPYSKGTHDSDDNGDSDGRLKLVRENLVPVLEAAGADLVLAGHTHMYERSHLIACHYSTSDTFNGTYIVSPGKKGEHRQYVKPLKKDGHSGTIYVVAGASSKVDSGPLDHPVMVRAEPTAGSLLIDIEDHTLTARYIDQHAEVVDEFTISRYADAPMVPATCPEPVKEKVIPRQELEAFENKEIPVENGQAVDM